MDSQNPYLKEALRIFKTILKPVFKLQKSTLRVTANSSDVRMETFTSLDCRNDCGRCAMMGGSQTHRWGALG